MAFKVEKKSVSVKIEEGTLRNRTPTQQKCIKKTYIGIEKLKDLYFDAFFATITFKEI